MRILELARSFRRTGRPGWTLFDDEEGRGEGQVFLLETAQRRITIEHRPAQA